MSTIGYVLELRLSNDHTMIHYSEHFEHGQAVHTLDALGYPVDTITAISTDDTGEYFGITGQDHLYAKVYRINRIPRPTYDFVITVRITGERDGWSRTILDTPKFVLVSNTSSGCIYTWNTARNTARLMFNDLMQPGDAWHVTIAPYEHTV